MLLFVSFLSESGNVTEDFEVFLQEPVALFPISLKEIENEAFAGTAITTVVFHKSLLYLGEKAFLNSRKLTDIYIPISTVNIGFLAVESYTVIHGAEGSYAQKWAQVNGYEFRTDDIWNSKLLSPLFHVEDLFFIFWFSMPLDLTNPLLIRKRIRKIIRSMRPQERTELYPIDYRFP